MKIVKEEQSWQEGKFQKGMRFAELKFQKESHKSHSDPAFSQIMKIKCVVK